MIGNFIGWQACIARERLGDVKQVGGMIIIKCHDFAAPLAGIEMRAGFNGQLI